MSLVERAAVGETAQRSARCAGAAAAGCGGGSPLGRALKAPTAAKRRARVRMSVWFAPHKRFAANSAQYLCVEILRCRGADRSLTSPGCSFTRVVSWVSVRVVSLTAPSRVVSVTWSSWMDQSETLSELQKLLLRKPQPWFLRTVGTQRSRLSGGFWVMFKDGICPYPGSRTCLLNFPSTSVMVLLVLPEARTQPKHLHRFRFHLPLHVVLWQHLLRLWRVTLQFWVSFLPRRNHTSPPASLAE